MKRLKRPAAGAMLLLMLLMLSWSGPSTGQPENATGPSSTEFSAAEIDSLILANELLQRDLSVLAATSTFQADSLNAELRLRDWHIAGLQDLEPKWYETFQAGFVFGTTIFAVILVSAQGLFR